MNLGLQTLTNDRKNVDADPNKRQGLKSEFKVLNQLSKIAGAIQATRRKYLLAPAVAKYARNKKIIGALTFLLRTYSYGPISTQEMVRLNV